MSLKKCFEKKLCHIISKVRIRLVFRLQKKMSFFVSMSHQTRKADILFCYSKLLGNKRFRKIISRVHPPKWVVWFSSNHFKPATFTAKHDQCFSISLIEASAWSYVPPHVTPFFHENYLPWKLFAHENSWNTRNSGEGYSLSILLLLLVENCFVSITLY